VVQAPLNGLGNPINVVYPADQPVASNLNQKITSTKQHYYSLLNSVGTDRNYSIVGAYDDNTRLNIVNYCTEVLAMLKHKIEGGNFRSLAWKNRIPAVRQEFMGAIAGESRVVPFHHAFIVGQMDFIFEPNPDLAEGQYDRSMATLKQNIKVIEQNGYMLKQLRKIVDGSITTEHIEDPNKREIDGLFIRQQLSELALAMTMPFFCYACAKGIQSKDGVISHLNSKHKDNLNAHLLAANNRHSRRCERCEQWEGHHTECNPHCEGIY